MDQQASQGEGAHVPEDDEIDDLVLRVGEALDEVEDPELLRLAPSAQEATLALLGCALELRPGPWRRLCCELRRIMLGEGGVAFGTA
jgi:hypothetical protein